MAHKGINVFSAFNGMGCIWIALDRAGIKVNKRFSSEIDKHAIKINDKNYPDTIQLGDITKITKDSFAGEKIDLIVGGSPCQGFSFAGKQLNFNDPRSKLFFEFTRLMKELDPTYYLLENVRMLKEYEAVITRAMGSLPIMINSTLVSAQNRERLYWTNIGEVQSGMFGDMYPGIQQPKDKGVFLRDVLEMDVPDKYFLSETCLKRILNKTSFKPQLDPDKTGTLNTKNNSGQMSVDHGTTLISGTINDGEFIEREDKALCLPATYFKGHDNHGARTMIKCVALRGRDPENPSARITGQKNEQRLEARKDDKTNTLTSVQKDNLIQIGNIYDGSNSMWGRVYDPDGKSVTLKALGGGGGAKTGLYAISDMDKANTLTPDAYLATGKRKRDADGKAVLTSMWERRFRRLTPIECVRLQTVPDGYTDGVSDSQRYKMLGNGWTVDVIAHILGYLPDSGAYARYKSPSLE